MGAEQLVVRAYDPSWPLEFDRLRQRALNALGDVPMSVEHVGSTAVPGLAGKPVIDIDVVVSSPEYVSVALDRLATVGYAVKGRGGVVAYVGGLTATRWPPGERRHHLYIVIAGSRIHRERLAFRDYLRAHPEEAQRYGDLKRRAAQDADGSWERYAQIKQGCVRDVMRAAMAH
jgi:GrpB-like predicted nucleotidyltransferase (UPF0157 family)